MSEVHDYGCTPREIISELQDKIELLKKDKNNLVKVNQRYLEKMQDQQSKIEQLESKLKEIDQLMAMRNK